MNISATFQKRNIELYYSDLMVIRESLQEYNILFFCEDPILLNEMDLHRWAALKLFYDKVLVPKIEKGKPAKEKVKLLVLPGQLIAVFRALQTIPSNSPDVSRIIGNLHRSLFNIPYFNSKSLK